MNGYIKLFRQLKEWEWYSNKNVTRVFIDLLLSVNFKPKKWQGIEIQRGQIIIGLSKYAESIGLSLQELKTVLKKLKSTGEITTTATNRYTIITICNFESYQSSEDESNQQSNQQTTNKQLSNNFQSTFNQQQLKKVKNNNKEKNENNLYPYIAKFENFQKGKEIRRTQLDKNFNFALFPAEYSDNLKNEILKYFKYLESKKGDNWGVLGTLSSQLSVLKSYYNKFPEAEIIEALNDTQSRGNVSYNPEWTKNRKEGQRETKTTKQNNHSSDGTPSYMMGLKY